MNRDNAIIESLIDKYGIKGVEAAINRLNEWNMWDKPKSDDFYSAAIRQAERNRPRLIDVVDELPKRNHDAQRYKDDPEYHEHIRRLEAQLRKTTDPQEAEYLERRINKLKSLSESIVNNLNEDSNINYSFSDFWHLLDDYAYYNGQYKHVVGKYVITIKDIFDVDTLKCTSINHGTHLVLAQWIYPTSISGLEIGIWCGKDGWEYISNVDDLERFFGKNNLMKIYNHINK